MGMGMGVAGKMTSGMGFGYIPDTQGIIVGYRALGMGIKLATIVPIPMWTIEALLWRAFKILITSSM
eukprot:9423995-Ditylum_brightwellii.AAC.1